MSIYSGKQQILGYTKVKSRKSGFNNRGFIAKSGLATAVKLVYYKVSSVKLTWKTLKTRYWLSKT